MNKLTLFFRYILLLLIGLPGAYLFYLIFTPLTIYPVLVAFRLIYPQVLLEGIIFTINNHAISIVPACIAGAAYYFLLIINLATPMDIKTRVKSIIFMFLLFLLLNIIRIIVFSALFIGGFELFDIAHKLTWYFGSTILVVAIWFLAVYIFKIKSIPVYTDFKTLFSLTRKQRKRKK